MIIDTEACFKISQANQDFPSVRREVDKRGWVILTKNSKPKYLMFNIDALSKIEKKKLQEILDIHY